MKGVVPKARLEPSKYEHIAGRNGSAAATARKKRLLFISSRKRQASHSMPDLSRSQRELLLFSKQVDPKRDRFLP
jgi:hypothetical protein